MHYNADNIPNYPRDGEGKMSMLDHYIDMQDACWKRTMMF